jgi:hypothetical protein
MTITQTVDIPDSHRLTIDIPREIPTGRAILAFTLSPEQRSDSTAEEHVHTHPCPICAAHLDPVTGNPRYKPEVYEGMQEVKDMLSGKIPSTLRRFKSVDEMFEDLDRDDPDDLDD